MAGIDPRYQTPFYHPALIQKNIIRATPAANSTMPRRKSYQGRNGAPAGEASNSGGTGCPFSTIVRTVRCSERAFAQLTNMITATMATGAPKTESIAMIAIGIAAIGKSSLDP